MDRLGNQSRFSQCDRAMGYAAWVFTLRIARIGDRPLAEFFAGWAAIGFRPRAGATVADAPGRRAILVAPSLRSGLGYRPNSLDAATRSGKPVLGADDLGLEWTADGRILFPWEGSGWLRICAIDVHNAAAPHCLTPDGAEVSSYRLSTDGKSLFYTSNVGDTDHWRAWSQRLDGAVTALTDKEEEATALTMAGGDIAVMTTSATQTAHPVIFHDARRRTPSPRLYPQA